MLTIFSSSGQKIADMPVYVGSKYVYEIMRDDYISLKFKLKSPIIFRLGDYCDTDYGRFELVTDIKPTYDKASGGFSYDLKLEAQHLKWRNKILKYLPLAGGNECSFKLTATAETHLKVIEDNVKSLAISDSSYKYNGISDWRFEVCPSVERSVKLISFDNTNILDALTSIAEEFKCEWWRVENTIYLGKCGELFNAQTVHDTDDLGLPVFSDDEYLDLTMDYNVADMSASNSSEKDATSIIPFGSTRNISPRYRKELVFSVSDTKKTESGCECISDLVHPLSATMFNDSAITERMASMGNLSFAYKTVTFIQNDYTDNVNGGSWYDNLGSYGWTPEHGAQGTTVATTARYIPVVSSRRVSLPSLQRAGTYTIPFSEWLPLCNIEFINSMLNPSTMRHSVILRSSDGKILKQISNETQLYNGYISQSSFEYPDFVLDCLEKDKDLFKEGDLYVDSLDDCTIETLTEFCLSPGVKVKVSIDSGFSCHIYSSDPVYKAATDVVVLSNVDGSEIARYPAVFNPNLATSQSEANWILLPPGVHLDPGTYYKLTNLNEEKVKSSYFTSVYYLYSKYADIVKTGVVESHLLLPREYDTHYHIDVRDGLPDPQRVEDVVVFEEVYPKAVCEVTEVIPFEAKENVENDDSTISHKTYTAFYVRDSIFTANQSFDTKYQLPQIELEIHFQDGAKYKEGDNIPYGKGIGDYKNPDSGKLNGWIFKANWVKPDGFKDYVWEVIRDDNAFIPNELIRPEVGDEFVITGYDIELVNKELTPLAEQELLRVATLYVKRLNEDKKTYNVTLMPDWAYSNFKSIPLGRPVNLVNEAFISSEIKNGRKWGRKSRVIGFEVNLDIYYDNPILIVGEKPTYSKFGDIQDQLDALNFSRITSPASTTSGKNALGNSGFYIIGSNDPTPSSDTNVYSALRADNDFAKKNSNEIVTREWDFRDGATFGSFLQGLSGAFVDRLGNMEVASLTVRNFLQVFELIYNRLNAMEGEYSFSDSATVTAVHDGSDGRKILYLKKRWSNDFTAFQKGDIIYGIVNDLTTSGVSVKAWGVITDVDRAENCIEVQLYPANATPDGYNGTFTEDMVIAKHGNSIEPNANNAQLYDFIVPSSTGNGYINKRQSSFFISAPDGCIKYLHGVNSPIITRESLGMVLGRMPKGMFPDNPAIEQMAADGMPRIYAKGIITQELIRLDYKGLPIRNLNYRGEWNQQTAESNTSFYTCDAYGYDVVSYNNGLWECVAPGTTTPPSEDSSSGWSPILKENNISVWSIRTSLDVITKDSSGVSRVPTLEAWAVRQSIEGLKVFDDPSELYDCGKAIFVSYDTDDEVGIEIQDEGDDEIADEDGDNIQVESLSRNFQTGDTIYVKSVKNSVTFYLVDLETGQFIDSKTVNVVTDGKDGKDGTRGPMAYPAGDWIDYEDYDASNGISPIVKYGSQYYILKDGASWQGSSEQDTPAEDSVSSNPRWQLVDKFSTIFTDIILANFGKLSEAVFYGDYMLSAIGTDSNGNVTDKYQEVDQYLNIIEGKSDKTEYSFKPNMLINLRTGQIWGANLTAGNTVFNGEDVAKYINDYGAITNKSINLTPISIECSKGNSTTPIRDSVEVGEFTLTKDNYYVNFNVPGYVVFGGIADRGSINVRVTFSILDQNSVVKHSWEDTKLYDGTSNAYKSLSFIGSGVRLNKGTYRIKVELEVSFSMAGGSTADFGANMRLKISNITANRDDEYKSIYGANGFVLGDNTNNYILANINGDGGLNFIAESRSGYGIKITSEGLMVRDGATNFLWKTLEDYVKDLIK